MTNYKTDLQRMLRSIRMASGFTQLQVARFLQVNRSTYAYYETGETSPDVLTLRLLAAFYRIPIEAFIFPEEYKDMDLKSVRVRAKRKPLPDLRRMGDLTMEEKELVMAYRAEKSTERTEGACEEHDEESSETSLKEH